MRSLVAQHAWQVHCPWRTATCRTDPRLGKRAGCAGFRLPARSRPSTACVRRRSPCRLAAGRGGRWRLPPEQKRLGQAAARTSLFSPFTPRRRGRQIARWPPGRDELLHTLGLRTAGCNGRSCDHFGSMLPPVPHVPGSCPRQLPPRREPPACCRRLPSELAGRPLGPSPGPRWVDCSRPPAELRKVHGR